MLLPYLESIILPYRTIMEVLACWAAEKGVKIILVDQD